MSPSLPGERLLHVLHLSPLLGGSSGPCARSENLALAETLPTHKGRCFFLFKICYLF